MFCWIQAEALHFHHALGPCTALDQTALQQLRVKKIAENSDLKTNYVTMQQLPQGDETIECVTHTPCSSGRF